MKRWTKIITLFQVTLINITFVKIRYLYEKKWEREIVSSMYSIIYLNFNTPFCDIWYLNEKKWERERDRIKHVFDYLP